MPRVTGNPHVDPGVDRVPPYAFEADGPGRHFLQDQESDHLEPGVLRGGRVGSTAEARAFSRTL
ncbi:MAG: hypothetical protein ACTSXX_02210 [Candidatus Baldrarchaeia archaeon]